MTQTTENQIEITRINNDVNGNPRYVCHFYNLLSEADSIEAARLCNQYAGTKVEFEYEIAIKKAKKIGGHKFNNKQYGGGIVFQSYNNNDLTQRINEIKNS